VDREAAAASLTWGRYVHVVPLASRVERSGPFFPDRRRGESLTPRRARVG